MQVKKTFLSAACAVAALTVSSGAFAIGGASGPHVTYPTTGKIGAVNMNPYGIAPLTAVIRNGGYTLTDVTVHIVPKQGGQEIKYKVSDTQVRTHGGIPVFGLYPDYRNTVEVSYTKFANGKSEKVTNEKYRIYAGPANLRTAGYAGVDSAFPKAEVKKNGSGLFRPPLPCEQHDRGNTGFHPRGVEQPHGRGSGMEPLSLKRDL